MKDLDLTSLRYFVAVCESGNISRAADKEHVVPSAVSKRLTQLEVDLGVSLLERQRRGVSPTGAGEILLEHSRAILASAHRIAHDVASHGTDVRGHVRLLGTVSSIAESLPDDVAAFMKIPAHREIKVDLHEGLGRDIARSVREGNASLGILWDATDLSGLQTTPYRTDHLAVVVHASHPLAARESCRFEQTLDYEHVGLEASSAVIMMLDRAAALAHKRVNYRSTVSNFEAALRVVRANLGLSVIPKEVAGTYADVMGLKVIPLSDPWAKRQFSICYRDADKLTRAARLLLDFLQHVTPA